MLKEVLKATRGSLVSAEELAKAVAARAPIRILNGTCGRPLADRDNNSIFLQERIPQSSMLDIDEIADKTAPASHQTPKPTDFNGWMKKFDISSQDEIVVYDDNVIAGSCKIWGMFRQFNKPVKVLDGGFAAYKKAKGIIETGPISYKHRHLEDKHYEFKFNSEIQWDKNDIDACSLLIRKHDLDYEIVDARAGARFRAEVAEPRPGLRSGNIPGSKNVFFKDLLNEDLTFKTDAEIRAIFQKAGVNLDKHIAMSCGSSVTASVLFLALDLIGHTKNKHFYGPSWSEYGKTPQATDEEIQASSLPKSSWYQQNQKVHFRQ